MCDPTGISETALIASIAATTEAASAAAVASAGVGAVAAGTTAAAVAEGGLATAATGFLGTGLSTSTVLGLGSTIASTGLSMLGRKAQADTTNGLYIKNAENQNIAAAQTYNSLGLKQSQESDQTQTANFDVLRGMAEAKGKSAAAAGEAGVGGVSFSNIFSDVEMRAGRAIGTNDANYAGNIQQAQDEKEAAHSRAQANITGMPQASPLALWAGMGADLATGGLKIYDITDKATNFNGKVTPTGTTGS